MNKKFIFLKKSFIYNDNPKNSGLKSQLLNSSYDFNYFNKHEITQFQQTHFT